MWLANTTVTGDPILDMALNFGLPGLAMVLLYLGLTKTKKSSAKDTETMIHIVNSLKAIEKRLSAIESKEDARENMRERHLAVFEQLTKQIADEQSSASKVQDSMLRVMERQLAILEHVNGITGKLDDKIDACRTEIRVLEEKAVCKVGEATVRAQIKPTG